MRARWAVLVGVVLLQGCLTTLEKEPAEIPDKLDVVPNDAPFDPSKAVDDTGKGELAKPSARAHGAVQQEEENGKGEEVATEGTVEARKEESEQAAELANENGGDDDAAKAEVAKDPPPPDPGSGEPWWRTTVDWCLELLIVVALALLLAVPVWLLLRALQRVRGTLGRRHGTARRFREA